MHTIVLKERGEDKHSWWGPSCSCTNLQQAAAVSIHVRPWVLSLALLQENVRDYLIQLADQTEKRVIWKVLLSKFPLASVAWVSLAQHCMAISWDNLQNPCLVILPPWDAMATSTCPLFSVLQIKSFNFSLVTSDPTSSCNRFNHTSTS